MQRLQPWLLWFRFMVLLLPSHLLNLRLLFLRPILQNRFQLASRVASLTTTFELMVRILATSSRIVLRPRFMLLQGVGLPWVTCLVAVATDIVVVKYMNQVLCAVGLDPCR